MGERTCHSGQKVWWMLNCTDMSFRSNPQGGAVVLAHGEVFQRGMLGQESVRDVSTPMLL